MLVWRRLRGYGGIASLTVEIARDLKVSRTTGRKVLSSVECAMEQSGPGAVAKARTQFS
jgi:hypothetical protein